MNLVAFVDMLMTFLAARDDVHCRSEERPHGRYASSDDRYIRLDTGWG